MMSTKSFSILALLLAFFLLSFAQVALALPPTFYHDISELSGYAIVPANITIAASSVSSRSSSFVNRVQCSAPPNQNWKPASTIAIAAGIRFLSQADLILHLPARSCSLLSCSYNSAIYGCNDNDYAISHPLAQYGAMAQDLKDTCTNWRGPTKEKTTMGQAFDDGGFNVSILMGSC